MKKGHNRFRSILAHIVLVVLAFLCLFFFYILIVNATRSHSELQKGFSALPGTHFLENLKNVVNDGSFPMVRGILNSLFISAASAVICTYFSSLPISLVEAARIDGSGEFRTFNKIVIPIMKPAIAVQAIFTFVGSWNNYFVPALVIQSKQKMTVPILIATLRGADYMNFDMGKIYHFGCHTWWCKRVRIDML